jgi:hypothetical protein
VTEAERLAILETKMAHYERRMDEVYGKVAEMHSVLLQAKGAKYVIMGTAGVIGFFTSLLTHLPFVKRFFS